MFKAETGLPKAPLYDERFEHDACGIGACVSIKGIKTHKIVDDALKIVENLEHRAGKDGEGKTGDGVGIMTQIPHEELELNGVKLHSLWARRHGTKFNGAPYIVQRAGEAVYSDKGQKEIKELVSYYMRNAGCITENLSKKGFEVYGGVNAPYIWLKTPDNMTSWEFFDDLLNRFQVVGTPGSGFGPSGEHFFRLTAFGNYEKTLEALDRIR